MQIANIHQAKTNLSELLRYVERGEVVLIARAGRPIARLSPLVVEKKRRVSGQWKGKVKMAEDFDELPEEILLAFEGEGV